MTTANDGGQQVQPVYNAKLDKSRFDNATPAELIVAFCGPREPKPLKLPPADKTK